MKKFVFSFLLLLSCFAVSAATVVKGGKMLFHGIVTPDKPVPTVAFAARELAYHFKRATGAKLPIITEAQRKAGEQYFFLGNCKTNAVLNPDKMAWQHGIIKINKNSIQIAGLDGDKRMFYDTNSNGTLFAVYEFLEKYLHVRWIWPGKDGEVIPRCRTLVIKNGSFVVRPTLLSSDFRSNPDRRQGIKGWSSLKAQARYFSTERIWLYRHRFVRDRRFMGGHAFSNYYKTYSKTHPEFFSLLPNGKRTLSPYKGTKTHYASTCVTNKEFIKTVIANWAKDPSQLLNLNENDTAGECVCDNCLTADRSPIPNAKRRAAAKKAFDSGKNVKLWAYALGSLSNRYCQFIITAQKEADKINPNHLISGLIYANYSEPPTGNVKLNRRIHLRFCPPVMYPFTKEKIANYKRIWGGWAKTGASLQFRPNFTWSGHYFPVQYHKEFYDMYTFAYKNNMSSSDMDRLTGQYMVQGLVNYVIVSLNHRPDAPLAQLEDEFYSFFGAAKEQVKKYFEYVTEISMVKGFPEGTLAGNDIEGGMNPARYMIYAGDTMFTPEVMAKCFKLVDDAAKVPGLDKISARRVKMLYLGLKQIELAMKVQKVYRKCQAGAPLSEFYKAYAELQEFRKVLEPTFLTDMGRLYYYDNLAWLKPIREQKYLLKKK